MYLKVSKAQRKQKVEAILKRVEIDHRADHFPQQLSGGQQQRVAVARALIADPKFILADEPTGNLDSLMARQVMELLHNLNQEGTTIIMVTHDPDQAREVSRNIQIIDGQISDFKIYAPLQQTEQPSGKDNASISDEVKNTKVQETIDV